MILCTDPKAYYRAHEAEVTAVLQRVLRGGHYILGDEVAAFEQEFASYLGARYAVGVGSGTDALWLALEACGISAGDEVVTTSFTCTPTVAAIERTGATPVFVDIEPEFFTIDPSQIEAVLTQRTKAIVPVHLYGQAADVAPILAVAGRYNLRVIEDCCQAHGATYQGRKVGTWGDVGCFSFYPTKNLGALGDGGAVVTDDAAVAEKIRYLREYGWVERFISSFSGWNSRLDELQAAVLRLRLRHLDAANRLRQELARYYQQNIQAPGMTVPAIRDDAEHVFHLFVIRASRRNKLQRFLTERGIHTQVHYPVPVHLQSAYSKYVLERTTLPKTERAAQEILSIPLYPELTSGQQKVVIAAIREFVSINARAGIAVS